jgi:RNA polymerase sigma factor (sigma-70 family)
MSKKRIAELVCRHGTAINHCSICQSSQPHEIFAETINERVEAARPRLLRLALLNGIGPDEAEDVVQETLLEAWRHLEKLREPERFSSWLDGICRNVCKRHLHARTITPHVSELPESLDEESLDLPDPLTIDPAEELERQDMQVLLDRALGHLSESTRKLVELCYLSELPQREVAQRLDMSLGALELKLHRARRQLHQILHGELREDARAFGLMLDEDEAMGWQETRLWCILCGKQRLRGIVEHRHGGASMRLRCPECSSRYDTDFTNTGNYPGFLGPIRSFRPAFKRVMQAGAAYYQTCLNQQRCPTCQSRVQIQTVDRSMLVPPYSNYDALPLGIYVRVDCPSCGTDFCEAYTPAMCHPTIRDFLLRPRVLYEPATLTSYKGSEVVCFRLVDLSSTETLTVMVHPQTLQVLAMIEQ